MAKRYALHPGGVFSRTDGQLHHIGAGRLAALYGVDARDCIVIRDEEHGARAQRGIIMGDYIHLYPRYDGNYVPPKEPPCTD